MNGENKKAFETKLNIYLSQMFNERLGIQSISETYQGKGRPDILIFIGGVKLVIEGSYTKRDAEDDIKRKIEKGFAEIGIALHYKQPIKDLEEKKVIESLQKSKFDVKIYSSDEISQTLINFIKGNNISISSLSEWFETDVFSLSSVIKNIYEFIIKEEFIIRDLEDIEINSNDFIKRLNSFDKNKKIAKKLYDIFYHLYGLHIGDYKEIAELLYAQSFLNLLLSTAFYQTIHTKHTLESISSLVSNHGQKEGLFEAYRKIRRVDYSQIYDMALNILEYIPEDFLKNIINLGTKLGSKKEFLKRDFSGKIYHKIVGEWSVRKGFATYYTTIPASYMLSYLSIFSEFGEFKKAEDIKICDFACGSGTLLTATYSSLEDLYKIEKFREGNLDIDKFHKKLLEKNFWGFDALRYALQIASLNLVFQNPSITIKNMNFFSIPLGVDENRNTVLGSLRFLKKGKLIDYFDVEYSAKKTSTIDSEKEGTRLPNFDLIIMNPPFTRATGRGGREGGGLFGFLIDDDIRNLVLEKYNSEREEARQYLKETCKGELELFKDGTFGGIGQAGEGLLFLYLATQRLNENGRIAFVLPKSILSGASWFLIRAFLLKKFHLEYVVVSYDRFNGYNFSESTNLSEMMFVARKKGKVENSDKTKFIMLLNKPKTAFEAKAMAKAIIKNGNYAEFGKSNAYVKSATREELKTCLDNWGRFVAFPNLKLINLFEKLNKGIILGKNIPITNLGKIATIGIDRHQFSDNFTITNKKTPGSYPVVHGGHEEQRSNILVDPNARCIPKNSKADDIFNEKAGNLLIPDRIRINTTHTTSIFSNSMVLSNIFYAVKLNKEENLKKYKAICVWLNSVFGIIQILGNRQETEGAWISLKMSHWRLQKVIDIEKIDNKTIDRLSCIFDKYSDKDIKRLPQQFNPIEIDNTRLSFDKEILDALKIKVNDSDLKNIYEMLYQTMEQWFKTDSKKREIKTRNFKEFF